MADDPRYGSSSGPTQQQTAPLGGSRSWQSAEIVQVVRVDRPVYTGMMFGFGLMIAGVLFLMVVSVVLGLLGFVLGGALVS